MVLIGIDPYPFDHQSYWLIGVFATGVCAMATAESHRAQQNARQGCVRTRGCGGCRDNGLKWVGYHMVSRYQEKMGPK